MTAREHDEFYAEHYSDWDVHAFPLVVYIPAKSWSRSESLAMIHQALDAGDWDIKVSTAPSADTIRKAERERLLAAVATQRNRHWQGRKILGGHKSTSYDYGYHDALTQLLASLRGGEAS